MIVSGTPITQSASLASTSFDVPSHTASQIAPGSSPHASTSAGSSGGGASSIGANRSDGNPCRHGIRRHRGPDFR